MGHGSFGARETGSGIVTAILPFVQLMGGVTKAGGCRFAKVRAATVVEGGDAISLYRSPDVFFSLVPYPLAARESLSWQAVRRVASVNGVREAGEERAERVQEPLPAHGGVPPDGEALAGEAFTDSPTEERRRTQRRAGRQPVLLDTRVRGGGRRISDRLPIHLEI